MPEHASRTVSRSTARLAATVVRLAAAYILAGAIAKVLWGTPADLPAVLRDNAHGQLGLLFELVAAVEVFAAVAALVGPRIAWPCPAALLLVFLGILGAQLSEGATSCGCFGSSVEIPPLVMIVVDAVVLLAIFAVRPWRSLSRYEWNSWGIAVASVAAVGASAYLGFAAEVPQEDLDATDPFAGRRPAIPADAPALNLGVAGGTITSGTGGATESTDPPRHRAWRLPEHFPRYVILAPDRWVGTRLNATNLATWADVSKFPSDAHLVFYYDTCGHCADHLRLLAEADADADADERTSYVLIQLPRKPDSRHPVRVDRMPEGLHVSLPAGTRWIIKTPWEVTVKDGRVTAAEFFGE